MIAHEAATTGMVLLRNRALLPLANPTSIAVIGEGARIARTQGGGSATVIPASVISPLEGIRERWPHARVDWSIGAVVQAGIAELPAGTFMTRAGEPGMTVRYLDGSGVEIARETRTATSLVWFGGDSVASRSTSVEFAFRYSPEKTAAPTRLGLAGLADFEVIVDGESVAAGSPRTAPGDDPATAVLNPPSTSVAVAFNGGPLDVVVRFTPVAGGIPDALALRVGIPPLDSDEDLLIADAADAARTAELAIVVVSTSAEVESEGFDRGSLRLPGRQDDLVRAVVAANPRTIVVVNAGAPVLLPWRDEAAAVLACWFPGQEFGAALADVLSGDAEPGGRLPVTWPATEDHVPVRNVTPVDGRLAYDEEIHIGYRAYLRDAAAPAYPFGHGLGYTTWRVVDVDAPPTIAHDSEARILVTLDNVGTRPGKAVVQAYLERVSPSAVDRPVRWLAGFAAVTAAAGQTTTAELTLSWRRFAHWNSGWSLEPGDYRLRTGFSSTDLPVEAIITVLE